MEATSQEQKLKDFIKGVFGEEHAAMREEFERKSKEHLEAINTRFALAPATPEAVDSNKGIEFTRVMRSIAAFKKMGIQPAEFAKKQGWAKTEKALSTLPLEDGGFLVPPDVSADIIELLYNKTAVRALGATTKPMPRGALSIPKLTGGVSAEYVGENRGTRGSQITGGMRGLAWKKLMAVCPISNDEIRDAGPRAESTTRDQVVQKFKVAEDAAFLRGPGSGVAPRGVDSYIPTANIIAAANPLGDDLTLVSVDLSTLPRRLEEENIPMIRPGWIMSPRTKWALMQLRDNTGNFYYRAEMAGGKLLGFPFISTNQVPSTLGAGSDESLIYFGDWTDFVIGESLDILIDVSAEASYTDEAGVTQSAFALDQTVLRAIARHDCVPQRDESFAKLTGIKWGKVA